MVAIVGAYVDGLPIPNSSRVLTRDASVYLAGGFVKCLDVAHGVRRAAARLLCFAELVARYPISGAIFQWSSRLAGTDIGFFTGWVMVIGQILTVATAAIAMQTVLPAIWPGFQIVGGAGASADPTTATGAQNAVLLGVAVLVQIGRAHG